MKYLFAYLLLYFASLPAYAQSSLIVAGPMPGQVELRSALVWVELSPEVKTLSIQYARKGDKSAPPMRVQWKGPLGNEFNPVVMEIGRLEPATTYTYTIEAGNGSKKELASGELKTKELWRFRKPPSDFSFLSGSCSYFNEPAYDRPGKPYGGDSTIYLSMARESADFMIWLGDNWYTREVDFHSRWGLWYRAHRDRKLAVLQPFLKSMPHLAIWDDHDYGPNDIGKEYILKEESRKVFMNYWANPGYGEDGKGIYTKYSFSDVDFFLLDDRTWRSADHLADSVDGRPNPIKQMFGSQQMDWLKNGLRASSASFKIIVTGSQVLNPVSPFDCFRRFPSEYLELMDFLRKESIRGVLFLTGDRHHSEVIKVEGILPYPLYDVTSSPLTSGTHVFGDAEKNNPYRVIGIDQKQNYAHISVSGEAGNRVLRVVFKGIGGEPLGSWECLQDELGK